MARIYDFTLPVSITGIQDSVGVSDLQDAGLWDQIPADLAALVQNCVLVIEARAATPDGDLLGYYDGIPLSERDSHYGGVLPDRIVIFRDAILELCQSEAEVVDEVRITVWHEVAHYFGIDDERLHDLGYE